MLSSAGGWEAGKLVVVAFDTLIPTQMLLSRYIFSSVLVMYAECRTRTDPVMILHAGAYGVD